VGEEVNESTRDGSRQLMDLILALAIVLLAVAILRKWAAGRRPATWSHPALHGKQLVYSEKTFRSKRHGIIAKIDRGYLAGDTIELLEYKTRDRHRVYRSDLIELSAQRVAVEDETGRCVDDAAYVLTERNRDGTRQLHTVTLLSREALLGIKQRHEALLSGRESPRLAASPALCLSCAYLSECGGASERV